MLWFDIADKLLPPVYRAIKDMYAYAKALNDEFLVYVNFMERILKNFFIQTCDLQTVEYWERLLGLTVTEGETIEERKQEILEHLNNQHAITEPYVREQIERFFPGNEYRLYFEDGKPYDLNIDIFSEDIDAYRQALAIFWPWLNKMVPAHLKTTMARAIDTEFDRPVVISHGHYTALLADIGLVERSQPPMVALGGTIDTDSQTSVMAEIAQAFGAMEIGAPVRNPKDFDLQADSVPLDLGGAVIPGEPVRNPKDFELSGLEPLNMVFGARWSVGFAIETWQEVQFSANDYWWSGVLNTTDKAKLENNGLAINNDSASPFAGNIGAVQYDPNRRCEVTALYQGIGENPVSFDASNFRCAKHEGTNYDGALVIANTDAFTTPIKSWGCRIHAPMGGVVSEDVSIEVDLIIEMYRGYEQMKGGIGASDICLANCMTQADADAVHAIGLETYGYATMYGYIGQYGAILYNPAYRFEILWFHTWYGETQIPATNAIYVGARNYTLEGESEPKAYFGLRLASGVNAYFFYADGHDPTDSSYSTNSTSCKYYRVRITKA